MSYSVAVLSESRYKAGDDRQPADGRDTPGVGGRRLPAGRRLARCRVVPSMPRSVNTSTTSRRRPRVEWRSIPLVHHHARGRRRVVRLLAKSSKLGRLICGSPSARIRCAISGAAGLLETSQKRRDAVGAASGRRRGVWRPAEREHQADSRRGSRTGIRPSAAILEPPHGLAGRQKVQAGRAEGRGLTAHRVIDWSPG